MAFQGITVDCRELGLEPSLLLFTNLSTLQLSTLQMFSLQHAGSNKNIDLG